MPSRSWNAPAVPTRTPDPRPSRAGCKPAAPRRHPDRHATPADDKAAGCLCRRLPHDGMRPTGRTPEQTRHLDRPSQGPNLHTPRRVGTIRRHAAVMPSPGSKCGPSTDPDTNQRPVRYGSARITPGTRGAIPAWAIQGSSEGSSPSRLTPRVRWWIAAADTPTDGDRRGTGTAEWPHKRKTPPMGGVFSMARPAGAGRVFDDQRLEN